MKKAGALYLILVLLLTLTFLPLLALAAATTVSLDAPAEVTPGADFVARVNISQVENFDSCNYDLSYDPSVIKVTNVSNGSIDGTEIPVVWGFIPPGEQGTIRVIQNLPGVTGVSGEGYLAEIHFHVLGEACNTSELDLHSGKLSDNSAGDIPAEWIDGSVGILATLTTNAAPPQAGSVTGAGCYDCSSDAAVEAIPADACWYFTGWSGDLAGIDNPTTIHMDSDKEITANFAKYQYDLTVDVNPAGGGDVKVNGVIPESYPATQTFDCCTYVSLEAVAADGYRFTGWSGNLAGSVNPTSIHIAGNKSVTAQFEETTQAPSDPGDANGDGVVNSTDITKLERIMLMLDAWVYCGADANGDGVVNSTDITKIERIMLGLD